MLIPHVSLAVVAVGALAGASRGMPATAIIAVAATIDVALGAPIAPAVSTVVPLAAFIAAALGLATLAQTSGLVERIAARLAAWADGNALALYGLVCGLCALATAALSLDGAVVLMVPVVLALHRRYGAPLAPLFVGAVVVVNAASIAVPQGNPTNLVLITHAGLTPAAFLATMLVPGLAATVVCAVGVAILERGALRAPLPRVAADRMPFSRDERCATAALVATALATVAALIVGVAPWWPFAATTAVALVAARARVRPRLPWGVAVQVAGLVVIGGALTQPSSSSHAAGTVGLLALATILSVCCAVANNLPVGAWAASIVGSGLPVYAASIGLAVGAIATRQGSVATLIASDLAGPAAPAVPVQRTIALAAAGVLTAVLLLVAGA